MRLLILGGTLYLGRHLVEAARARGHVVTLFNRGITHPDLFPDLEALRGDRDGDLSALEGRDWDAVVDASGYVPRQVRATATRLRERVPHHTFMSSISVYADMRKVGLAEEDAVAPLPEGVPEELTGEHYGALKARCERALAESYAGRALIVRAGLIVGPHDATDRSAWWPRRIARGGEVLAPGEPGQPVQMVDARDLADWIVRMAERKGTGTFNATGPDRPLTMGEYLETCRQVTRSDARFTWVDESFLLPREVRPMTLPLWVPKEFSGFESVDARRAWAAGLVFRPLAETVHDAYAWDRSLGPEPRTSRTRIPIPVGIAPAREAELLKEWHAQGKVSA